ncbi:hypothetical protein H7F53_13725, partial [Novosphingobium piscinae]
AGTASARAEAAASQAQAAASAAAEARGSVATLAAHPVPEGFRNGATTIRLGGYLKLIAAFSRFDRGSVPSNTLGRDFYLPQVIPTTPGGQPFSSEDFTAKQTRLWLSFASAVAGHSVKGYLETDFQTTPSPSASVVGGGSQRTTNGYTLALRRGTLTVDRFTFGQDWTTFQYTGALPESTDYVGGAEGTVFVREPLIRYSAPLSRQVTLHLGVENPESALAMAGTAAIMESGTDHWPDLTARLVYTGHRGELSLAGLVRQVRGESTGTALVNNTANTGAVGRGVTATGLGASLGGKLFLNAAQTSDLRFIAAYGQNIGRYVGLNFAPDAVYDPASNSLRPVDVFAALVSAHVALAPQLRFNLMGSYQAVHYAPGLTRAQLGGLNKQAYSAAANLFYSPLPMIDLGLEYRHGARTVINATTPGGTATGRVDRVEFAAKYSF